ncbi:hypothetical protein [Salipiger thiooxidans]|uniref:hypothetical protein n=1 Tax=Salipiger thiooxidans TaxID=282683 RepID=UPI001CFA5EE1|nr:hypothetical protein [Salipiger thiooxidans]
MGQRKGNTKEKAFLMQPKVAAQMFRNLVKEAGGKEAAAATISSAVSHSISPGSLTRIENGNAEVPLLWVWALMDATGNPCFDTYRGQTRVQSAQSCPYQLIGEVAKEHGEAIEWGLKAARSSNAENWSRAAVEHKEAADKHLEMSQLCEARAAGPTELRRVQG